MSELGPKARSAVVHLKLRPTPSLVDGNLIETADCLVYAHRDQVVFVPLSDIVTAHDSAALVSDAVESSRPVHYDGLHYHDFTVVTVAGDNVMRLAALKWKSASAVAVAYESGLLEVYDGAGKAKLYSHSVDYKSLQEFSKLSPPVYATSLAPLAAAGGSAGALLLGLSTGHIFVVALHGPVTFNGEKPAREHFVRASRGAAITALATRGPAAGAASPPVSAAATAAAAAAASVIAVGADDGSVGLFTAALSGSSLALTPWHLFESPAVIALGAPAAAQDHADTPFITGAEMGLSVTALAFAGATLVAAYSTGHLRSFTVPVPPSLPAGAAVNMAATAAQEPPAVCAEVAAHARRPTALLVSVSAADEAAVMAVTAAEDGCVTAWTLPAQPAPADAAAAAAAAARLLWSRQADEALLTGLARVKAAGDARARLAATAYDTPHLIVVPDA